MTEFNATAKAFETASALELVMDKPPLMQYPVYVGLDVHKATIAVAPVGCGVPEFRANPYRARRLG